MKSGTKQGSTTAEASGVPVHCSFDELADVTTLVENPRNPNKHGDKQVALLAKIIRHQGWRAPIVISTRSGFVVAGHGRLAAARLLNVEMVPVNRQAFASEADEWAHLVADNRIAELADPSRAELAELLSELDTGDFDMDVTGFDQNALEELMTAAAPEGEDGDAEAQTDKAAELNKQWQVKPGDVWTIGGHRLLCGDSTKAQDVARLMGGDKAVLVHADPPYGMGKEKDGVANDNLYADKLDAFQMAWWKAARLHVADNGSAYIWGNSEDLWRLWYRGGLKDSERLTFRNLITWDKPPSASAWGSPVGSELMRSYPHGAEYCLFFMLGEQGFNNNADNYWEGWEPVRKYLADEMAKLYELGWTRKRVDVELFGCTVTSGGMLSHYIGSSQWGFITEKNYKALQQAAGGSAFKREHDDLKREFYSTRAYFDNAHDNMTDVWDFPRVTGEERHEHATPKPVAMIQRCIKSSSPDGGLLLEPFLGSGTTMVAAQNLGRKCYGIEISPDYCAVILQRMKDAFPSITIERRADATEKNA